MIDMLAKNQNWAKITPLFGILALMLLFVAYSPNTQMFWALINIPLYAFHQTEEHVFPGGFKDWMNKIIFNLPQGEEKLTDIKIFWINITFVWIAFLVFGALAIFVNIGFGLLIIIFSIINCLTHIREGVLRKAWNPGLVIATVQFSISLYAVYFITINGIQDVFYWWIGSILFSILAHVLLFKLVMSK